MSSALWGPADPATTTPWLVSRWRWPAADVGIVCFPYAGGGASMYARWHELLPARADVHLLQLPGRETRLSERPIEAMDPLVDAVENALRPLAAEVPLVFFGHSLGALVAFEVAHRFHRAGAPVPRLLVVAGCRAPHLPKPGRPTSHLSDEEFLAELARFARTPAEILDDGEALALFLPSLRADFRLFDSYACTHTQPLPCPITAFGAVDDDEVDESQLLAWRSHTSAAFRGRMFAGDHFFVRDRPEVVTHALREDLARLP